MDPEEAITPSNISATALPAELNSRLAAAMTAASNEVRSTIQIEQLLKRFSPATMSLSTQIRNQQAIKQARSKKASRHAFFPRNWTTGLAALLCVSILSTAIISMSQFKDGTTSAAFENSLVSRNVIESKPVQDLQWKHGESPQRSYEVLYEDSFVIKNDNTTIIITVPNKTRVSIEESVL